MVDRNFSAVTRGVVTFCKDRRPSLLSRRRIAVVLFAINLLQVDAADDPTLVCAKCHPAQSTAYPMSQAAESVATSPLLTSHPRMALDLKPYSYVITREGSASSYTVTDGAQTLSVPILWAFGRGTAEQTYLLKVGDNILESRVSYYSALDGLDLTPGASGQPKTLEDAAGRRQDPVALADCFACHTTGAVRNQKVNLDQVRPGVHCDACHEGALQHAAAILSGDASHAGMTSLKHLSAERISNFCGRCHRSTEAVLAMDLQPALTIRFQPYRLALSRCFQMDDERISCVACHNPHQKVVREAAFYDAKCLACHGAASAPKRHPCPRASSNCTTCHMPRVELPNAHQSFADHFIRVARRAGKSTQ